MFSWEEYQLHRISPTIASDVRHDDVVGWMAAFANAGATVKQLGESVEGRAISLVTLGSGEQTVLAWSQMHGNEPTHTAALADLINFLLHAPEHPTAAAILSQCTLHAILMLNPDGAQRWTRRNAQDIDVNRDALHVQSPEGQLLREAVLSLAPNFAFNLHNHRPHTTVGQTQQPAAFSLLVPPIDSEATETETVLQAKRLASYLAQCVAPYCPGPVSRYNADYMPRCFGEWIQQQGAATLTIEAGGWTTLDAEPLVQLHFYGLAIALEAIATGAYAASDSAMYDSLPRTGEHDLFDKLLREVTIVSAANRAPIRADLGINFARHLPMASGGTIVDLGDLHVTSGKELTPAASLTCLPGRIAWIPELSPSNRICPEQTADLLSLGVTTVLGTIDVTNDDELQTLYALCSDFTSPVNEGFLAKLTSPGPELLDRLLKAIAQGVVGVLADELPSEVKLYLSLFNFPIVSTEQLPHVNNSPISLSDCATNTQQCANLLGLRDRGSVCLNAMADLVLLQGIENVDATTLLTDGNLHQVLVGGNVVFQQGQLTGNTPGTFLHKSFA